MYRTRSVASAWLLTSGIYPWPVTICKMHLNPAARRRRGTNVIRRWPLPVVTISWNRVLNIAPQAKLLICLLKFCLLISAPELKLKLSYQFCIHITVLLVQCYLVILLGVRYRQFLIDVLLFEIGHISWIRIDTPRCGYTPIHVSFSLLYENWRDDDPAGTISSL